jgi:hypothetical protein
MLSIIGNAEMKPMAEEVNAKLQRRWMACRLPGR